MKMYRRAEVQFHIFLPTVPALHSGRLKIGRRLGGSHNNYGRKETLLTLPGVEPRLHGYSVVTVVTETNVVLLRLAQEGLYLMRYYFLVKPLPNVSPTLPHTHTHTHTQMTMHHHVCPRIAFTR
jgi:hypothetical protein